MVGHIIIFYGEIWLIIPKISLLPLLIWSTETFDLDEVTHDGQTQKHAAKTHTGL